jgi:hypothetical protein
MLTVEDYQAITKIGWKRKEHYRVGSDKVVNDEMVTRLLQMGIVRWVSRKQRTIVLTRYGRRIFRRLHPYSKQ